MEILGLGGKPPILAIPQLTHTAAQQFRVDNTDSRYSYSATLTAGNASITTDGNNKKIITYSQKDTVGRISAEYRRAKSSIDAAVKTITFSPGNTNPGNCSGGGTSGLAGCCNCFSANICQNGCPGSGPCGGPPSPCNNGGCSCTGDGCFCGCPCTPVPGNVNPPTENPPPPGYIKEFNEWYSIFPAATALSQLSSFSYNYEENQDSGEFVINIPIVEYDEYIVSNQDFNFPAIANMFIEFYDENNNFVDIFSYQDGEVYFSVIDEHAYASYSSPKNLISNSYYFYKFFLYNIKNTLEIELSGQVNEL